VNDKQKYCFDPNIPDLTSTQFRQKIPCSSETYWRLIKNGEIEAYRVGRDSRITAESVQLYRLRHRIDPDNVRGDKASGG
jgi:excisionase family DNA binding protein